MKNLKCRFCSGSLGATETQKHDNPGYAKFKTCLKCGHQWAKAKWDWLERAQKAEMQHAKIKKTVWS